MTPLKTTFQKSELLAKAFVDLARDPDALVALNNYGSWDTQSRLVIPANNVGTVITFPTPIENYLYLEFIINGGISGIYAQNPARSYGFVGGISGTKSQTYTVRLPYCGPIDSLLFQLGAYTVRNIRAVQPNTYTAKTFEPTVFGLLLPGVWTYNAFTQEYSKTVFPTQTSRFYLTGTVVTADPGYQCELELNMAVDSGLSQPTNAVTYYDGVNSFSNFFSDKVCIYPAWDTNLGLAYFEVTNNNTENMTIYAKCRVLRFNANSNAFGSP